MLKSGNFVDILKRKRNDLLRAKKTEESKFALRKRVVASYKHLWLLQIAAS